MDDEEMTGTGPVYGPTARAKAATQDVACARWGIAYHTNSHSPRAKKWYRVSRMVYADGGWFELYWHSDVELRGNNVMELRRMATLHGLNVWPGLFRDKPTCRRGSEMEHIL